ncbi:MAG: response regulator transcription factor [Thermodesulfovibrionia bacterium]|nr:response regulator transcription factor [Thermodesulfovibrionia bacterium]
MTDTNIKILIADDHKIMRDGLRTLLEKQADFQIVAEAGDGRTAVKMAQELSPDLIVMDASMPDMNGIEATRQIISSIPGIKIIALSMHSDRHYIVEMLKAGASGYVLKDCAFDELISAMRSVLDDAMYLSPKITDTILTEYINDVPFKNISAFSSLTNREREVLQLIAEGNTTKEIAGLLGISIKTVETHRQQLMNKLKIHSIAGLTKYAVREGLTSL